MVTSGSEVWAPLRRRPADTDDQCGPAVPRPVATGRAGCIWQSTDGSEVFDAVPARIEMRSHSMAMPKYSVGQAICSRWTAAGSCRQL